MSKKTVLYTKEGYDKLIEELSYLKNVRREEIKEDIAVARSFGDLSENAEYDEARNEQAKTEARIKELEEMIVHAEIADETSMDASIISMGSTVKVYDEEFNEDVEYQIVGSNEADPLLGKISDMSPIGMALVGKKAGETVDVETPGGICKLKILDVMRSHNNG